MLGLLDRRLYLFALVALFMAALPAHAALVTYSDVTSWTAASTGITTIDFEGLAPTNSFKDYSTSTGYAIGGVQFTGLEAAGVPQLYVYDAGYISPYFNFGTGATLVQSYDRASNATFVPKVHVALPSNVTAFGIDLMTQSPNALQYHVTLSTGDVFDVNTATRPTTTFFGFTTGTQVSYIDFTLNGTAWNGGTHSLMDNVRYGTANTGTPPPDTPEMSTMLLIGTGLIGIRMFRKLRTRQVDVAV